MDMISRSIYVRRPAAIAITHCGSHPVRGSYWSRCWQWYRVWHCCVGLSLWAVTSAGQWITLGGWSLMIPADGAAVVGHRDVTDSVVQPLPHPPLPFCSMAPPFLPESAQPNSFQTQSARKTSKDVLRLSCAPPATHWHDCGTPLTETGLPYVSFGSGPALLEKDPCDISTWLRMTRDERAQRASGACQLGNRTYADHHMHLDTQGAGLEACRPPHLEL